MDVFQNYILVTYNPFDVHIFHVKISGGLVPAGSPVIQVWYPSHGRDLFKQEDVLQLDPELEFDREIYPLGLLPNVGVVVGVTQRMSFSTSEFPWFEPTPQAQTILHCLLRHLLQREKGEEALRLAHLSPEKQHFSHCFEWLLFKATLDESLYELAGELVWFLLRSGREFESATSDSDRLSPRFLSYFLFRSPSRRQSSDLKSGSFKELSPHIASVKNILENHASYLMSGKELSKLVAFVKGTQFDIVEYLQREKLGSAWLDNFALALELIGQKLHMDTLQSRLDAQFLLAHMCSVKFKEWILVLGTLLRRAESREEFRKYLDLLNALEEQLSSVTDNQVQNGSLQS